MDDLAQDMDPVATVTWNPPLYPDTVDMTTGHTREQEMAQLRTELQVKCQELADVEIERAVTVLELEQAQARAGCYLYRAERVEAECDEMRRLFRCANKAKREAKRGH